MDGMAKVTNCTMEQLLRIHTMTDGWVATLPLVAMMINAMPQSRTRKNAPSGGVWTQAMDDHGCRLPLR